MPSIAPYIKPYFPDGDGQPLAGGLLHTFETGTTTPKTTYKYSNGTAHSNPIVLDSRGEIPDDAGLYLDSDIPYRFRLERADATEVWTRDGVTPKIDAAQIAGVAPITVDTIAAMKALDGLVDGAIVSVTDFYGGWAVKSPPVPEGGGNFVWNAASTATEVTGHVVKSGALVNGRFMRILNGTGEYDVLWSGVRTGTGYEATNTTLLDELIAYVPAGSKLLYPLGLVYIDDTLTIDKSVSHIGRDKLRSGLYGVGFASDVPLIDYAGTTGSRIQDIEIRKFAFWSDNNLARGITLTWVNKSCFEDIYFYQLYRGMSGSNSFSNNFKNISTFSITQDTGTFGEECNNLDFTRVECRGTNGFVFNSSAHGLNFDSCDFEGITSTSGRALLFAPATGKKISGIVITGSYFENIKGGAISCAGVDANSVRGLAVKGNYIHGGYQDNFGSAAGNATHAIILTNVKGFDISDNQFEDWETNCFFLNGTESNGNVEDNTIDRVTNFSNTAFSPSVKVRNNDGKGRKEEWRTAVPASGSYTQGDFVHNTSPTLDANNMVIIGWTRLTTGSNHVLGTDWARAYASHLSPAT